MEWWQSSNFLSKPLNKLALHHHLSFTSFERSGWFYLRNFFHRCPLDQRLLRYTPSTTQHHCHQ